MMRGLHVTTCTVGLLGGLLNYTRFYYSMLHTCTVVLVLYFSFSKSPIYTAQYIVQVASVCLINNNSTAADENSAAVHPLRGIKSHTKNEYF